jgi:cellulose biosynthesis protein BcsQ
MSESMFVLAIISQKGGPGKSTFAVNLATAAAERGLAAVIIEHP